MTMPLLIPFPGHCSGVKESHRDPAGAMSPQTIRLQEANEVVTPAVKEVRRRYSLESSEGSITKLSLGPAAKDDKLLDEDDQTQIKKIRLRKVSSLDKDNGGVQSKDDAGGEQDRGDQVGALDVGQGSSARKKKDVNQNRKGNDFTPNSVITQKFKLRFRTIFYNVLTPKLILRFRYIFNNVLTPKFLKQNSFSHHF